MKRALLLACMLAAPACLDPGQPVYFLADITPPELLPPENGTTPLFIPDAGLRTVQAAAAIQLSFSEPLDVNSLRAGIVIRKSGEELPLLIQASPQDFTPFTVRVASGENTFASGVHSMTLRTLLIDLAGNPIAEERTGFFIVP